VITKVLFYFTRYALEKMDALGIGRREVEMTITQGMKWRERYGDKWHANMAGIEAVFMKEEESVIVITVYLAGGKK